MSHGPLVARTCICRDMVLLVLFLLVMVLLAGCWIGRKQDIQRMRTSKFDARQPELERSQPSEGRHPTQLFYGLHLGMSLSLSLSTFANRNSLQL